MSTGKRQNLPSIEQIERWCIDNNTFVLDGKLLFKLSRPKLIARITAYIDGLVQHQVIGRNAIAEDFTILRDKWIAFVGVANVSEIKEKYKIQ